MEKNMMAKTFVRDYALTCYTFDSEPEDYLIARLIHKHMRGSRVLDLGCGPVAPLLALFYPDAREAVAVDSLKENIDFMKNDFRFMDGIMKRALSYKHRYISKKDSSPRLSLIRGDVTKKLAIGRFDSAMQIGCFGALDTQEQFQRAVNNAYSYLKPGGILLMVNWLDEISKVKRPLQFNGKVNSLELYVPCLRHAGFRIRKMHTTSKLGGETKRMGYTRIVWAVAKK